METVRDMMIEENLTDRWTPMRPHYEQARLVNSFARFRVVPAGRRSGKTEIVGKRQVVQRALCSHLKGTPWYSRFPDPRYGVCAPTRDQAKKIYWSDLKRLVPKWALARSPNESQLIIYLINGAELHVLGMDKPERVEGIPWDRFVLDEIGNMKAKTWPECCRPALADRKGGADFIGVPEGRNHYYDLYKGAQNKNAEALSDGTLPRWDTFWWKSADILDAEEIADAKADTDPLTYEQEYEGSFVNFTGLAYYPFNEKTHCSRLKYNPREDLIFCFDFNVSPGIAVVVQKQWLPPVNGLQVEGHGIIGEVHIPNNSNTPAVCRKLIQDWGDHKGKIFCYGDFTGGYHGTSKVLGSDWQLIKQYLWTHFGHNRVYFKLKANPKQRVRINSVNSRLMALTGQVRLMVDPGKAPQTVRDFEGVVLLEGGSGEIDKRGCEENGLSHITDAIGYWAWYEYPVKKRYKSAKKRHWK